jgi:EmrB/QacA subfamily drug resistance transporter
VSRAGSDACPGAEPVALAPPRIRRALGGDSRTSPDPFLAPAQRRTARGGSGAGPPEHPSGPSGAIRAMLAQRAIISPASPPPGPGRRARAPKLVATVASSLGQPRSGGPCHRLQDAPPPTVPGDGRIPRPPAAAHRLVAASLPPWHIPRRPTSSKWLIFAIASMALFMSSVDGTIVATGLPTLRRALHTQINWASWTMTAYQLGLVVAMPLAGRVSDLLGRKRVFVLAACLFTVASLACGLATSIAVLIALRVLQAFGGAAFMPSASGMVADAFGQNRSRALGLFSTIFPLGAMVGPIFGGIIISDWSWRGIFLVNVPVGAAFTLLALRYFPSSGPRGGRADLGGAALLGAGILALMAAISHLGDRGTALWSPGVLLPGALAVGAGCWFVRRCDRRPNPLVPARLLRGRAFASMNLINLVWGGCAIGFAALGPLYAEERYGLSPLSSGTLLTARAIGEVGFALLASLLIQRIGYRLPMIGGSLLVACGLALGSLRPELLGPYGWLAAAAALSGVGIGISAPALNNASIELAPDDIGTITGLRGASRQCGSIVVVAVTTAVLARSSDQGATLGHAFVALALLLLVVIPVAFLVPDRRRRRVEPVADQRPAPAGATSAAPAGASSAAPAGATSAARAGARPGGIAGGAAG